jgi:putative endonuclease
MSGSVSYHAGLAAEDCVARHYRRAGQHVVARRWRGKGGEIDVIVRDGDETIFVEVKKASSHPDAALRVSERQMRRLFDCAGEYMGTLPDGMNSAVRFDVALVDEAGRIEVIENALTA